MSMFMLGVSLTMVKDFRISIFLTKWACPGLLHGSINLRKKLLRRTRRIIRGPKQAVLTFINRGRVVIIVLNSIRGLLVHSHPLLVP